MNKKSFNKYNPQDLFSQLIGTLSKEEDRGNMKALVKELRQMSSKVFQELKKPKVAKMKMKDRVAKLVNSIYYYDSPCVYRPTKVELGDRFLGCPKCKSQLSMPRQRSIKKLYLCPSCGFKTPLEKVLNTKEQIEEYMTDNKKKKCIDKVVKEVMDEK